MAHKRLDNDAYYTPQRVADACVRAVARSIAPCSNVLEPHAGGGAFVRALRAQRSDLVATVLDIDPEAPALTFARENGLAALDIDFLQTRPQDIDWIVGNPPYKDAQAHVEHALRHARVGVAFLLRLAFLESAERKELFREHPPAEVHVLVNRPSFAFDGKTDSAAYAFFVWRTCLREPTRLFWIDWKGAET